MINLDKDNENKSALERYPKCNKPLNYNHENTNKENQLAEGSTPTG
jgi:hypothetical protein